MKIISNTLTADKQEVDCLLVGIFSDAKLNGSSFEIDLLTNHLIVDAIKEGDFSAEIGSTYIINSQNKLAAKRILLFGCGERQGFNERKCLQAFEAAFSSLKDKQYKSLAAYLQDLPVLQRDFNWVIRSAIISLHKAIYQFDDFKSQKSKNCPLESLTFAVQNTDELANLDTAIKEAEAICAGMKTTKDLANTPCNTCTPSYIAEQAQILAKKFSKLKVKILDEKALHKMNFGAFCAVSQGSEESGKLIILEYHGQKNSSAPIALVGKGITFDTGGLSLKPPTSMLEMKYDMTGAATVFGTMHAIAELGLPINVVAALACAENMPDGKAIKPESVIQTFSGLTVEITNTDAEGRLVLCDTLSYMEEKYKPETMIDLATLTGAIVVALGKDIAGFFTNDQLLAQDLKDAAQQAYDPIWQLPIDETYNDLLNSTVADMMNSSLVRYAGSGVAAAFLSKFVKHTPWAHVDIAGTANVGGDKKCATGRGVPLLVQYLLNKSHSQEAN